MADTNLVYPYELQGGQRAVASEVMANFEAVQLFAQGINTTINEFQAAISDLKNKPTREMFDIYYSITGVAPVGAYPLWTGETITNCKTLYPQFWKKLNQLAENSQVPTVADNAAYEEKLEKYGQCASFFIDTLNGHVRLPKITRFISSIESLNDVAVEENDCNKTHIHNVKVSSQGGRDYRDSKTQYLGVGFAKYSTPWWPSTDGENEVLLSTEGEDEGHPKNVRLYLYLQVANNTAEISELDVNAIIEQMNEALAALKTAYDGYAEDLNSEYEKIKRDIINSSPVIKEENISSAGRLWVKLAEDDEYYKAGYRYFVQMSVDDAAEDLTPTVVFNITDAVSGNYAPVAESGDGWVKIYAKEIPVETLVIPCIILQ